MRQTDDLEQLLIDNTVFAKVFSRRLGETIILLPDSADIKTHSGTYVLYRINEIDWLAGLDDKSFQVQHAIRKKFGAIPIKK